MSSHHALFLKAIAQIESGALNGAHQPELVTALTRVDDECWLERTEKTLSSKPILVARLNALQEAALCGESKSGSDYKELLARLGRQDSYDLILGLALLERFWDVPNRELVEPFVKSNAKVTAAALAILVTEQQRGNLVDFQPGCLVLACAARSIGTLPLLDMATKQPSLAQDENQWRFSIESLSGPIGRTLALQWQWMPSMVNLAHRWRDMSYQPHSLDYVDIVRLAAISAGELNSVDSQSAVLPLLMSRGVIANEGVLTSKAFVSMKAALFSALSQQRIQVQTRVKSPGADLSASVESKQKDSA